MPPPDHIVVVLQKPLQHCVPARQKLPVSAQAPFPIPLAPSNGAKMSVPMTSLLGAASIRVASTLAMTSACASMPPSPVIGESQAAMVAVTASIESIKEVRIIEQAFYH